MHSSLMVGIVVLALVWQGQWQPGPGCWPRRWLRAWLTFCLPPLLVLSMAIAVLLMGHHGTMLGLAVSPMGCRLSQGVVGWAIAVALYSFLKGLGSWGHLRQYPTLDLPSGDTARLIETPVPMAAQVGLWRSTVLISRGWLQTLSAQEQQIILHHEQAHAHYRDPLCFFGLGLVYRFTCGWPRTEALWQELLLLREIRADRWAAQRSDPLLVAELLVKLSRPSAIAADSSPALAMGFSDGALERLEQRVEALLHPASAEADRWPLAGLLGLGCALLPLLVVGLHH